METLTNTDILNLERSAQRLPRLAITHGDPNGIGPEVALKAIADPRIRKLFEPILVGAAHVFRRFAHRYDLVRELRLFAVPDMSARIPAGQVRIIDTLPKQKARMSLGEATPHSGELAMASLDAATSLVMEGHADALVTAPISKRAIALAEYLFPGHTEYLADKTGGQDPLMMMVAKELRVGLVTVHTPLRSVPDLVTYDRVMHCISAFTISLKQDFGIRMPKIAVLGLNPHAGEEGMLGGKEKEVILPAIQKSFESGHLVFGPFPADGFFGGGSLRQYDGILAMYHDQGLAPFKALAFENGVNFTAGLPVIRTSPVHGTAFDLAGKGMASPRSMQQAMHAAVDILRHRNQSAVDDSPGRS